METKTQKDILALDLVPLSKFNDFFAYPLISNLRYFHFYNTYGFSDKVIRTVGKRLYIKISALQEWIEETGNGRVA